MQVPVYFWYGESINANSTFLNATCVEVTIMTVMQDDKSSTLSYWTREWSTVQRMGSPEIYFWFLYTILKSLESSSLRGYVF